MKSKGKNSYSREYHRNYMRVWSLKNKEKLTLYKRNIYLSKKESIARKFKENYKSYEFRQKKLNERLLYMYKWKSKAFELLGHICSKCGFSDKRALQFDHINGDGYKDNKKRNVTHYKKIVISVQSGEKRYQILCCNCNWIKRIENKEYHVGPINRKEKILDNKALCSNKETTLFPI